jgi:hypothetical protein
VKCAFWVCLRLSAHKSGWEKNGAFYFSDQWVYINPVDLISFIFIYFHTFRLDTWQDAYIWNWRRGSATL